MSGGIFLCVEVADAASNVVELRVKIFAGTIGLPDVQVAVPDDDALADGIELVLLTQPRRQQNQRIHLLAIGLGKFKVPRDANADGIFVVTVSVSTDCRRSPPLLNSAVLANDVMITDARPAVDLLMKFVDVLGGRILVAVGKARVVNNDDFSRRSLLVFRETQE